MSDTDATENKPARKPRKTPTKKTTPKKAAAPQVPATEAARVEAVAETSQPQPPRPQPADPTSARPATSKSKSKRSKPRSAPTSQAAQESKQQAQVAPHPPGPGSAPARALPTALIRVPMPVRWRDLDAFNHVNNSKYLSYLEEARLQWMLTVPGMGMDDHVAPVVAAAQLNYRRPITWPSQIEIELFVERLGNTSLTVGHRIIDSADNGVLFCDGHVVMVWIDRDSGAAAALPAAVREACKG